MGEATSFFAVSGAVLEGARTTVWIFEGVEGSSSSTLRVESGEAGVGDAGKIGLDFCLRNAGGLRCDCLREGEALSLSEEVSSSTGLGARVL